jgi:nitroreductase
MMTVQEAIESTNTCRFYRPDPVTDEVLLRVLDAARYAPSGGNRQPVRFIVVRNPATRRQLKEWYLPIWDAYAGQAKAAGIATGSRMRMLANADHFARHLDEVPVLLVVCAVLADIYPTDRNLERLSIVGGASVYPAVQNVLLKARDEGLGTALTTLLCVVEPQVKELLRIPDGIATAAMLTLGYPTRPFPKRLRRQPLGQSVFSEEFGRPLEGA